MKVAPVIWQLNADYPGSNPDDSQLPIDRVVVKTHDAVYWMSTFDSHPLAVSGPDAIRKLIDVYGGQGITFDAWCVPKSQDVAGQLALANAVLSIKGVEALWFDLEPYQGFCAGDCDYLATHLLPAIRQANPSAMLIAIYDPRPARFNETSGAEWLKHVNAAAPMAYWNDFAGDPRFDTPAACIQNSLATIRAFGFTGDYIPMLPGDVPGNEMTEAIETARALGVKELSLWRRGTVRPDAWAAIAAAAPFASTPAPTPTPTPTPAPDGATIEQRVTSLEGRVTALEGGHPAPGPQATYHTVAPGDTASAIASGAGLSWEQFTALNPGQPPSGDWNVIHAGEQFRIS